MARTGRPFPAWPWPPSSFGHANSQDDRASLDFPLPRSRSMALVLRVARTAARAQREPARDDGLGDLHLVATVATFVP